MISLSDLSISLWGYALETASFILNRAPSTSVETTPYELWHGKKPTLSFLRIWGCEAYVKKLQSDKFLTKGVSGRKVELDEIVNPSLKIPSSVTEAIPNAPSIEEEEGAADENLGELAKPTERRSTRLRKSHEWFGNHLLSVMLVDHDEPATYTEVMEGPEFEKRLEAMKSEIRAMYDNQVWTLVDIPSDHMVIENKWIFKKKY
jgi:hypothetical protein